MTLEQFNEAKELVDAVEALNKQQKVMAKLIRQHEERAQYPASATLPPLHNYVAVILSNDVTIQMPDHFLVDTLKELLDTTDSEITKIHKKFNLI